MLPESGAPPLANLDLFREFMEERGVIVRRIYESESEDEETGAVFPAYWQITIAREALADDNRLHIHVLTVMDGSVARGLRREWTALLELLDMGWKAYREEAGLA